MTDETTTTEAPAQKQQRRGWPKGKARPKKVIPGREPEDDGRVLISRNGKTYEYLGDDEQDRLKIEKELIPEGMTYLWVMHSILGKEEPNWWNRRKRTGWEPVPAERHDGLFMPKGHKGWIEVDGLVLCEKPLEFVKRDQQRDKMNAANQVYNKERQIMGGDVGGVAFDTQHPSAVRTRRVGKTYERIPVPEK